MDFTKYVNQLEYPTHPRRPKHPGHSITAAEARKYADALDAYDIEKAKHTVAAKAYNDADNEIYAKFKVDALKEVGLWGHEAGNRAFEYAWQEGHATGFQNVFIHLVDIAYVVTGK